jgi:drug/metabolite transporter (DMT)-like permease
METKILRHSNVIGHLQVVSAMCIVGSSVAAGKFISMEVPAFLASCLRFLIATLILIPLNYTLTGKLVVPNRPEMIMLTLQAFFGSVLFSVCMFHGLRQTSALNAGVIMGTLPAVTALVAVLVLNERLTRRFFIGIVLSVSGAVVLALRSEGATGGLHTSMTGTLLILSAVICEALFSVIGKLTGLTLRPVTMATWMSLIAVILFSPYAFVEMLDFDFSAVSLRVWLLLLYYAVVVTVVGFMLFYSGLAQVSSVAAGVHMAWVPLSSMLIAVTFLGDPFGPLELLSMVCVVAAVLVVGLGAGHAAQHHADAMQK